VCRKKETLICLISGFLLMRNKQRIIEDIEFDIDSISECESSDRMRSTICFEGSSNFETDVRSLIINFL